MKLLRKLRQDSSKSISEIARKLKKPLTTVFEAYNKLKQKEIITRYRSIIDFEKAGFPIRTVFILNADEDTLEGLKENVMDDFHINNLQLLEGNKLLAEAVFRSMKQLHDLNAQLRGVPHSIYYITEELKTEAASRFR